MPQVQERVRAGFPLLTLGAARSDSTPSALGALTLGSSLSLHGASQAPEARPDWGFLKMWVPLSHTIWFIMIHPYLNGIFHCKPSNLGCQQFSKTWILNIIWSILWMEEILYQLTVSLSLYLVSTIRLVVQDFFHPQCYWYMFMNLFYFCTIQVLNIQSNRLVMISNWILLSRLEHVGTC